MPRAEGIGRRVRELRILQNLTQAQLAMKVGVSEQYISMIESGRRQVETRSTLARLATALEVATNDLTGQPYPVRSTTDLEIYSAIPAIRAALDEPDDGPPAPRPMAELERVTDLAMAARMNCDMADLGRHLPGVLAETRALWLASGDPAAGELFVRAAVVGSLAYKAAGFVDLGIRLAELADNVARTLGPISIAAAQFAVAQAALTVGARRRSARIAAAAADDLDRLTRSGGRVAPRLLNDMTAWMGMLHLHAALSEATLDSGDPAGHLAAAGVAARHTTGDPWRMEFSEANVDVWRIGVELEHGDPGRTVEMAAGVDPNDLRTKQRRSRLYLDAGRGAAIAGDHRNAIRLLTRADQVAPGDLAQRASAVETVRTLFHHGRPTDELRRLAVRVGVDPVNPDPS